MSKIKKILALAIAHLPSGYLRLAAYRALLGYRFGPGCQLGLGVLIAVDHFEAGAHVRIRRGTSFMGPITVRLGDKTFIGRFNKIECGDNAGDASQAHMRYAREFITGHDSLINEGHLFDVLGRIQLGNGSWIAGFASQFLTHGAGTMERDIVIGDDCFLGSAVRFAPGAGIGNRVVVGMGSVVTKRLALDNVVVGGVPAKVLKERQQDADYVFEKGW